MSFVFGQTVAYKTPHNFFYRRIRGVVKIEAKGEHLVFTTRRGVQVAVPACETVFAYGPRVPQ